MFWADVGENPKIEMSWMDGSRRTSLVTTRLHHPTGLTIDTSMDHALYWVDTKLNVIESIKYDQKNRNVMIRGGERHNAYLSILDTACSELQLLLALLFRLVKNYPNVSRSTLRDADISSSVRYFIRAVGGPAHRLGNITQTYNSYWRDI